MNQFDWEKGLVRSHRVESELFAQKAGMNYEYKYKYPSWTACLSGNYLERSVSIELTHPIVGRSHYNYRIKCSTPLQISTHLKFNGKEKSTLLRFFQRPIPIAQQTGTNLLCTQYKTSGQPQSFVEQLLQSPDFCYSTLLLSPVVLEINDSQLYCECKGEHLYSYEIPLVLGKVYTVASAIESITLRNL